MSQRKIIGGAFFLVVITAGVTSLLWLAWISTALGGLSISRLAEVRPIFGAMRIMQTKYVEPIPLSTMITGAIKGIVDSPGDPHSIYMDKEFYEQFKAMTKGDFGGIGVRITDNNPDHVLTVVSTIADAPAEKAGIKAGDQIIKVDGMETGKMSLDEALAKMKGTLGTQVTLTIKRGNENLRDYVLTRSQIVIPTVAGKVLPGSIGYIRISMFNDHTGEDFLQELRKLDKSGIKGVILDLRDNPGGLLDQSVIVASQFVPRGPVVSIVDRSGAREVRESPLLTPKYPVVVLVNGNSASAAEIVAGAIQDTQVGVLVGTKTYGKGSVQIPIEFNGGAIKVTVAKYLTPKDRYIDKIGLEPDVKVEIPNTAGKPPTRDIQLDKAIEVMQGKLK